MGRRQPGPKSGPLATVFPPHWPRLKETQQGGQRDTCGLRKGAQKDRFLSSKESMTCLPLGRAPSLQKGSPEASWTVQEGPTRMYKESWACGPRPPASASLSHLQEGHLELLRPRALPVFPLGQDHLSGPAAGERAERRDSEPARSPSVPYFLRCSSGSSQCLSAGPTVGPA